MVAKTSMIKFPAIQMIHKRCGSRDGGGCDASSGNTDDAPSSPSTVSTATRKHPLPPPPPPPPSSSSPSSVMNLPLPLVSPRSSLKKSETTGATASSAAGGSRKKTRRRRSSNRKRVVFASAVQYRETISRDDYTDGEKRSTWLQEEEKSSIKQRCQMLVLRVQRSGRQLDNGKTLCVRGLEKLIGSQAVARRSYRFVAQEEVFVLQEEQYMLGYRCAKEIAQAYRNYTGKCQLEAELVASQDRKEVESYVAANDVRRAASAAAVVACA